LLASDSNPQPSDPKEWGPSDRGCWGHLPEFWADAGSLPGNLKTSYAHSIPGTQDEPLGFASLASAARLMDEILTPIPIDLNHPG
jgi:hypothetical protein